jgi:hypothetical protein
LTSQVYGEKEVQVDDEACCYPIFDPCFDKFSEKIQK